MKPTHIDNFPLDAPVIVFDGKCVLCDKSVQFVLRIDHNKIFLYCTTAYAISRHWIDASTDSVMLISGGTVFIRSKAVIKIFHMLGGKYRYLSVFLNLMPLVFGDVLYSIVAKNRYRWFGKYDHCILPDRSWAERFLG